MGQLKVSSAQEKVKTKAATKDNDIEVVVYTKDEEIIYTTEYTSEAEYASKAIINSSLALTNLTNP